MCLFNTNQKKCEVSSRKFARYEKKLIETAQKIINANYRLQNQKKVPQLVQTQEKE